MEIQEDQHRMSSKISRQRFPKKVHALLERFYSKHEGRGWKDQEKQEDLNALLKITKLDERQVYSFCKNKRYRDKVREDGRPKHRAMSRANALSSSVSSPVTYEDASSTNNTVEPWMLVCPLHGQHSSSSELFNPLTSHCCTLLPVPRHLA